MNTIKWIALFAGLQILAGCSSTGDGRVTTADGADQSASQRTLLAEPDADEDGVADAEDSCGGSLTNALVDDTGCEIVTGVIEGIKFAPSETELNVEARTELNRLVGVFLRYPEIVVSVGGHTDNRGSAASNLELSKLRVLSVVRYMIANGMNPDKIQPYGYGESKPRAANANPDGREQNRRIEINVVDTLL